MHYLGIVFKSRLLIVFFYGYIYIFRTHLVLWVYGVSVGAVCYSYGLRPAFNHSSFIGFIINPLYKANIQGNQEQRPRYPRLIGRSTWNNREEGLGFCAGSWWGWFVLREGTPPDKVNQGKSRGVEGKLSSPSEIRGISGIRITSKQWYPPIQIGILWVWRYVYVWVCVSWGDGGSVGNQGKRAAAMAWGRPRWSSVPVPLWR